MDTFDKLRLIKLTKNNCQILLNSNDGFIINTTYNKYLLSHKDRSNSLQSDEFNLTIP